MSKTRKMPRSPIATSSRFIANRFVRNYVYLFTFEARATDRQAPPRCYRFLIRSCLNGLRECKVKWKMCKMQQDSREAVKEASALQIDNKAKGESPTFSPESSSWHRPESPASSSYRTEHTRDAKCQRCNLVSKRRTNCFLRLVIGHTLFALLLLVMLLRPICQICEHFRNMK